MGDEKTFANVPPNRVVSVDAYRGLVMFLMMAEVLHLGEMARRFPGSPAWQFLGWHQSHVEWTGCSLHDLIQPSFSFLVGVALPFSLASRATRGQSFWRMLGHAVLRALILIFLGVFLRSVGRTQTNFTFEDTLSQIGLGYVFLFLLGLRAPWVQWLALVAILTGYWAAFALYQPLGADFEYSAVGVSAEWLKQHRLGGFLAQWDKNGNLAWAFDTWFLNLFPREKPFVANGGGYATLSFIPTLGTMVLGLLAGGWLHKAWPAWRKLLLLVVAGTAFLAAGWALEHYGICPIVKRIWTPAWVLYSGGWCFLLLAAFYAVIDMAGLRRWAFPLVVIGMNSIFIYCLVHLTGDFVLRDDPFIISSLKTHLGQGAFEVFGKEYVPVVSGAAVLLVYWLILYWMYRRKIFLRI